VSGFLLDTNVVSDLRKPRPNAGLAAWIASADEQKLFLSVLTIGELRIGITVQSDADLLSRFQGRILPFDIDVAQQLGRVEGRARLGSGKLPVVDSQLAATALFHGLTLVTNNEADFSRTGAAILNPWT
jgi:predicted nucleic acid-binding protein